MSITLSPIEEVLQAFKAGQMVIMTDDENRENEGDLIIATEKVTPEALAFMMEYGRGLICVSVSVELAERLNLPLQTLNNCSAFQTPFAVSIDHQSVVGSGVTAASRALTMRRLISKDTDPNEFRSPGHVFPLIAHPQGVIGRPGQTEGSYDLARLSDFSSSGVLCEILNPDGSMARGPQLEDYAKRHNLKMTSVAQIAHYRINNEVLVREATSAPLETSRGTFETFVFIDDVDQKEHLVLLYGSKEQLLEEPPLVRIHSECLTGDVFGSRRCDCGPQLETAMEKIVENGSGMILYLRQEGRGIGLSNKLKAYSLQDQGHDTVEANVKLGFEPDLRDFAVAAKILSQFGVKDVRLMTNNPKKVETIKRFGIQVTERQAVVISPDEFNRQYLETKRDKLGHWL